MEGEKELKITYKILKHIGTISQNEKGYKKEINLISYNNRESVIDIRTWSPAGKMSKGITIKKEDLPKLKELINSI